MTPMMLLFTTCLACIGGSIVPLINCELVVLAASAALPSSMVLPLIALASMSQMAGKAILYYAGSGLLHLPQGRFRTNIDSAVARVQRQKGASGATIFASASTGLPPFYVLSIASGAIGVDFRQFMVLGLAGRTLRCAALVLVPQLIKAAF
jgi:membrane protein YqaA with SNARE-associated domain